MKGKRLRECTLDDFLRIRKRAKRVICRTAKDAAVSRGLLRMTRHSSREMIRVVLPFHLRTLAHAESEITLEVAAPVTQRSVLDALEARYPMLRGTIRDQTTQQRRPFLRFFGCEEDLSHEAPDAPLPEAVAAGTEPFLIVGAIAGG
jgi:sulfur-carrier protein